MVELIHLIDFKNILQQCNSMELKHILETLLNSKEKKKKEQNMKLLVDSLFIGLTNNANQYSTQIYETIECCKQKFKVHVTYNRGKLERIDNNALSCIFSFLPTSNIFKLYRVCKSFAKCLSSKNCFESGQLFLTKNQIIKLHKSTKFPNNACFSKLSSMNYLPYLKYEKCFISKNLKHLKIMENIDEYFINNVYQISNKSLEKIELKNFIITNNTNLTIFTDQSNTGLHYTQLFLYNVMLNCTRIRDYIKLLTKEDIHVLSFENDNILIPNIYNEIMPILHLETKLILNEMNICNYFNKLKHLILHEIEETYNNEICMKILNKHINHLESLHLQDYLEKCSDWTITSQFKKSNVTTKQTIKNADPISVIHLCLDNATKFYTKFRITDLLSFHVTPKTFPHLQHLNIQSDMNQLNSLNGFQKYAQNVLLLIENNLKSIVLNTSMCLKEIKENTAEMCCNDNYNTRKLNDERIYSFCTHGFSGIIKFLQNINKGFVKFQNSSLRKSMFVLKLNIQINTNLQICMIDQNANKFKQAISDIFKSVANICSTAKHLFSDGFMIGFKFKFDSYQQGFTHIIDECITKYIAIIKEYQITMHRSTFTDGYWGEVNPSMKGEPSCLIFMIRYQLKNISFMYPCHAIQCSKCKTTPWFENKNTKIIHFNTENQI